LRGLRCVESPARHLDRGDFTARDVVAQLDAVIASKPADMKCSVLKDAKQS
jgi:hypothetical protein